MPLYFLYGIDRFPFAMISVGHHHLNKVNTGDTHLFTAWHHGGPPTFPISSNHGPLLYHFDFRMGQNSSSIILTSTRNPSAYSCSPASLQVVHLIPIAFACFCRGPCRKQKNNKAFLLLSLAVRQFVPIRPQAHPGLWLNRKLLLITAVLSETHSLYGNSWPLSLKGMEKNNRPPTQLYFPCKLHHLYKLGSNNIRLYSGFIKSIL